MGYFQFLAIKGSSDVNILVHVFWWVYSGIALWFSVAFSWGIMKSNSLLYVSWPFGWLVLWGVFLNLLSYLLNCLSFRYWLAGTLYILLKLSFFLLDIYNENNFSYSVAYFFVVLMMSLSKQKFLILTESNLPIFFDVKNYLNPIELFGLPKKHKYSPLFENIYTFTFHI